MKKKLPVWLRITLVMIFTLIILLISEIIRQAFRNEALGELVSTFAAALSFLGLVYWFRTRLDKESIGTIGIGFKYKQGGLGAIFAILAVSISFIILLLFEQVNIVKMNFNLIALMISLLSYFFVGFFEEIVFRGYIQTNLCKSLNNNWGLVISSLLFALLHGLNPDISFLALFNVFLAGFLLGLLYLRTGNLWSAIGFHSIWNFWQGPVLGFAVSGTDSYSLVTVKSLGADNITGGEFGMEGSIICTLILIASTIIVQYKTTKKSILATA